MNMRRRLMLVMGLLMTVSTLSHADDNTDKTRFYDGKSDGWFWYHDPVEPPKAKPEEPVKPATPAPPKEDKDNQPLSVKWLRKKLPELLDTAIDDPSRKNLAAYFYAQRAMMDKSQRFAEAGQHYVYSDPLIDENNRVPLATSSKQEFMNNNYFAKQKALTYLAKNVGGIVMFFDSKCEYCKNQARIVKMFGEKYNFDVRYVSMDGKGLPGIDHFIKNNGMAAKLHLQITPATVFIAPPNNFLIISQGMLAITDMETRVLAAAADSDLLPADMAAAANPWDKGIMTTDDLKGGGSDDPTTFVNNMKKRLEQRY